MRDEPRGHTRAPLSCGCSGDGGTRCAEGERVWQAMQAAGVRAMFDTFGHPNWPTYARARQAYMAHLAANRPVEPTEPRTKHPQEKPGVWRPAWEGQA